MGNEHLSAEQIGELVIAANKLKETGVLPAIYFDEVRDNIFKLCTSGPTHTSSAEVVQTNIDTESLLQARELVQQMERGSRKGTAEKLCTMLLLNMNSGYTNNKQTGDWLAEQLGINIRTVLRLIDGINAVTDKTRLKVSNDSRRGYFIERI